MDTITTSAAIYSLSYIYVYTTSNIEYSRYIYLYIETHSH